MSGKEKILEIVHSGAVSAAQEEPKGTERQERKAGIRVLTAQASNGRERGSRPPASYCDSPN